MASLQLSKETLNIKRVVFMLPVQMVHLFPNTPFQQTDGIRTRQGISRSPIKILDCIRHLGWIFCQSCS